MIYPIFILIDKDRLNIAEIAHYRSGTRNKYGPGGMPLKDEEGKAISFPVTHVFLSGDTEGNNPVSFDITPEDLDALIEYAIDHAIRGHYGPAALPELANRKPSKTQEEPQEKPGFVSFADARLDMGKTGAIYKNDSVAYDSMLYAVDSGTGEMMWKGLEEGAFVHTIPVNIEVNANWQKVRDRLPTDEFK